MNGWTLNNCKLRAHILLSLNPDIISLNETHLSNLTPELDGFTWIGHNRVVHKRAVKASGGVGIFVKQTLLDNFIIRTVDKTFDGALCLCFEHVGSQFSFIVISCHLSPETSLWGRNADLFFAHLMSLIYATEADSVYICGDFNSRIAHLRDYVDEDDMPSRTVLDPGLNKHGESFATFLKDSNCCVLNGRLNPENDKFTSISVRVKAVVDYIVVAHANFLNCAEFKVFTPLDLADRMGQPVLDMIDDRCRLPDHSVLYLGFKAEEIISESRIGFQYNMRPIRKLTETFLDSETCYTSLNGFIELLESGENTQDSINNCYLTAT